MPQKRSLESIVSLVEESRDRERGLHPVVLAALRELFENSKECRVCATLALKLGSTERTLRRWFSAQLGCTVAEMIGYVALYESLRLLVEDPYRTLEELAARTGYAHARTLACAWQRRTGISPAHAVRAVRELQLASGDESAWDDLQRVAAEIDRRRPPPPEIQGRRRANGPRSTVARTRQILQPIENIDVLHLACYRRPERTVRCPPPGVPYTRDS